MDYFTPKDNGVLWEVQPGQIHKDDVEMSGFMVDMIVGYGVESDGGLCLSRYCAFPTLRTIPNNTRGTLRKEYDNDHMPKILSDGVVQREMAVSFFFDGILSVNSRTEMLIVQRQFYPSVDHLAGAERVTVTNCADAPIHLTLSTPEVVQECEVKGGRGIYVMEVIHDTVDFILKPGEKCCYGVFFTARIANQLRTPLVIDHELEARQHQILRIVNGISLTTDCQELDTMFRLSVIRAGESIFHTMGGDFHSPGGKNYYAAVWCNDELEYAAPWFAVNGDKVSLKATENAFVAYTPFMSDSYSAIPSSIISEGLDIWNGAGDRGDAAMYLYGASYLVLIRQETELTQKLWPYIQWCAEYCRRKTGPEGVVCSRTDELETRIPTDMYANLSTSCICYGGLRMAVKIARQLGQSDLAQEYTDRANKLEEAIEVYFGETIHGMDTYAYSKGFHTLRAWICLPLCMGINNRRDVTLQALFSPYLWTGKGLLSCELGEDNRNEVTWDRSLLFAFKAAMIAERTDYVWDYFREYIHERLCGDRVPYAVEAYPENEMRHLSGESALFARIVPEGLLKLSPEGGRKYSIVPQLPNDLRHLTLRGLHLVDKKVDIVIEEDRSCVVFVENSAVVAGACGSRLEFAV